VFKLLNKAPARANAPDIAVYTIIMPHLPFGVIIGTAMIAGVFSASLLLTTLMPNTAQMYLLPERDTLTSGDTLTLTINVRSFIPVNVFKGLLQFDTDHLIIERIDYNTSLADLWAEEPWYKNGDGTLSFIGGSTKTGGFTGDSNLITVTFKSLTPGEAKVQLKDVRILQHDGYGTDAPQTTPIDTIFTVTSEILEQQTVTTQSGSTPTITILTPGVDTDLNNDGLQTITDISIFMRHLGTQNKRSDFNRDGIVNTKDLSIILNQKGS